VRVYTKGDDTFACYLPTGKTRRLGDFEWFGPVAASGRYVAWDMSSCDSHNNCVSRGVRVVDMKTRLLRRETLPPNDDSYATSIVVTTAGSAAWIRARDVDNSSSEVRKLEGRRQTVLDTGDAIEPWSLAVAGYPLVGWRIYWTNADAAKTARLR
jgi:hypothetical protein